MTDSYDLMLQVAIGVVVALVVLRPKGGLLQEALRILPDTIRLLRGLATDRSIEMGVRLRLWFLFVYLASPVDFITDFVPVLGCADDAIIVAIVLHSVVRRAGPEAIRRNWTGTSEGLSIIWTLARFEGAAHEPGPLHTSAGDS
ncbi:MAG: YkvA family protein [bacterium]|nr:YkvA family protein [bacterium]